MVKIITFLALAVASMVIAEDAKAPFDCLAENAACTRQELPVAPLVDVDLCFCGASCLFANSCYYYTLYANNTCVMSQYCDAFEEDGYEGCFAGQGSCAPPQCSDDRYLVKYAYINRPEVGSTSAEDVCACDKACEQDSECIMYTYYRDTKECRFFKIYGGDVESCSNCVSGVAFFDPETCTDV